MKYTKNNPLRVVTLCSGYDSQCMALDRLKRDYPGFDYDCIAWAEIDKYAIQAHDAVFPQYRDRNMGDITSCDWSKITQPVDLLVYSTPCTSISFAGKQEGLKKGSGTASSIIWSVLSAIDALKPQYLLMENVKALVSKKFIGDFHEWQDELSKRGYSNFVKVLNSKCYGIPQNRERVFMVSILDEDASFHFPEPFPLERRLKDILEEDVDEMKGFLGHNRRHQEKGTGFLCRPKTGKDIANALRANGAICPTDNMIIEPRIAALRVRNPENPSDRTAGCPTEQRLEIGGNISNTVTTVDKDNYVIVPFNTEKDGSARTIMSHYSKSGISNIMKGFGCGDTGVIQIGNILEEKGFSNPQRGRIYSADGISPTINTMAGGGLEPKIIQKARGNNNEGEDNYPKVIGNRFKSGHSGGKIYDVNGISPTVMENHNNATAIAQPDIASIEKDNMLIESASSKSVAEELQKIAEASRKEKIEVTIDGEGNLRPHRMDKKKSGCSEFQTENELSIASTLISARPNMVYGESTSFRIRKLTPREVFRLMDVSEENIDRIQAAGISRTQQYKMAGNSICTGVLFHIFRKLFIDTEFEGIHKTLF